MIVRVKRGQITNEVKPVKDIDKNLQSFLGIDPVPRERSCAKEVAPSHQL